MGNDQIIQAIKQKKYKFALTLCLQSKPESISDEAELHTLKGRCYWFIGDYENAKIEQKNAICLFSLLGLPEAKCFALIDLGMVYDALPDYESAIISFQEAYSLSKKIGSKHLAAVSIGSIGLVHARMKRHLRALEFLNIAFRLFQESEVPSVYSEFLSRSVPSFIATDQLCNAQHIGELALDIAKSSGNLIKTASAYRALGLCAAARQEWQIGIELFEMAINIYKENNAEVEVARTYYEHGVLLKDFYFSCREENIRLQALTMLQSSLEIYISRGYQRRQNMVRAIMDQL